MKRLAWAGILALVGCHRSMPIPVAEHPHYEIGAAWQGEGGVWFYPRERFSDTETGLAVVMDVPAGTVLADGVRYDPGAMTGEHQTLQVPSVVSVRNLENGRMVRLRLDGRGPRSAGRMIGVSPRVAGLLGMGGGPARVEIVEDEAASRGFAEATPAAQGVSVERAPVGEVQAQSLDADGRGVGQARAVGQVEPGVWRAAGLDMMPLPAVVTQGVAQPGALWVELGRFATAGVARRVAARCAGEAVRRVDGHGFDWLARLGPYADAGSADSGLAASRGCGISGARVTVE